MIVRDPVCGTPIRLDEIKHKIEIWSKEYYFCSEECKNRFIETSRIAYFSMEIGILNEIPTYSGGLGVLAGDTIRSSADLKIHKVFSFSSTSFIVCSSVEAPPVIPT